jgi:ribosome-associated translation inhibitor RaiA
MESKIKVTGDFERVNDEEKGWINVSLDKFTEKYSPFFEEMHINLSCERTKETSRGRPSYVCKANVVSDHGKFHADNTDFGAEKTIVGTLDKIQRQIAKVIKK